MNPPKRYQKSLFIFRRDLRCDDNTALIRALESSAQVIACFIFDPRQTGEHPYKSEPAFAFMLQSLKDLQSQLKKRHGHLFIFEGLAHEVVGRLIEEQKIDAVYLNEDYTPFSVKRDLAIKKLCADKGVAFHSLADALLNDPRAVTKNGGGIYTVYTPFFKKASTIEVAKPVENTHANYFTGSVRSEFKDAIEKMSCDPGVRLTVAGGRTQALGILNDLKKFKNYDRERDLPAQEGNTKLSAHHKFGTCSIRESWHAVTRQLGKDHTLIREFYWRDFFSHIAYHFPHVFGHAFYEEYDSLQWSQDEGAFGRWCEGRTGFPIVDAGMRELNTTGFMHNRVRMITASFLVKDLHIDWRWGERYFAQRLVDYDPCVNNGNWQWVASTGCDHQPYFRVFNPWLQQKRFDEDCRYIKRWVPELRNADTKRIHERFTVSGLFDGDYPAAMVDHSAESAKAKEMFKSVRKREV